MQSNGKLTGNAICASYTAKCYKYELENAEKQKLATDMLRRAFAVDFIKDFFDYVILASQDHTPYFDVRCYMSLRIYRWIYNDIFQDPERGVKIDPLPLELRLEYVYENIPAFLLANYAIER